MMLCRVCASYFSLSQSRMIFLALTGINPGNIKILTMLSIILNITVFSILFILNKTLN